MAKGNCGNRIEQSPRVEVLKIPGLTREDLEKLHHGEMPADGLRNIPKGGKLPSAIQKIPLPQLPATKAKRLIPDVLAAQNVPLPSSVKEPKPQKRDDTPCFPKGII